MSGRGGKATTKSVDDALFDAGIDICTLQKLFEVVLEHAQTELGNGDPAVENFALTLECLAEKGIRECGAAMERLHSARKSGKVSQVLPEKQEVGGGTVQ